MAIRVLCGGCRTTFTVSDKFAGRTGPCPKCKKPITVPAAPVKEVTIHGPEEEQAARPGRPPLAPIEFKEIPVPAAAYAAVAAGGLVMLILAFLARLVCGVGEVPPWMIGAGVCLAAMPCAWLGYEIMRNRDLEPYRGRTLLVRTAICGAVYAALWGVRGFLPPDLTADLWPWVYVGPPFVVAGGVAALASFDLDWGSAVTHYAFYVMFTAALRGLAGFMPL